MSSKYLGEVSLRFKGDTEEAQKYAALGRLFLGQVFERNRTLGYDLQYQWERVRLPNGVIFRACVNTWIPILEIEAPPGAEPILEKGTRLILPWEPEGILLTPVSPTFPDGIGLPMRDPDDPLGRKFTPNPTTRPFGYTPGGIYPQVLINQYENNKYLDNLDFIAGLPGPIYNKSPKRNPRLRDQFDDTDGDNVPVDLGNQPRLEDRISWEYATLFGGLASYRDYTGDPGDEAPVPMTAEGYYIFNTRDVQLDGGLFELDLLNDQGKDGEVLPVVGVTPVLNRNVAFEPEATTWYTHRPEELLYELAVQEGVFQRTNFFRTEVETTPFLRPLRGQGPSGYWGSREIGTSQAKYWGHSHPEFTEGMKTAGGRNIACVGQSPGHSTANNPCENAVTFGTVAGTNSLEKGASIVQFWRDSPGHYAAIISSAFEPDSRLFHYTASFDIAYCDATSLDVGAYSVGVQYETYYDVNSADGTQDLPFWNETTWDLGPSFGANVYTQIFQQREWWLPAPEWTTPTYAGSVGKFGSPNVWGGFPQWYIRRFSVGARMFDIPPNNHPPYLDAISTTDPNFPVYDQATDTFAGILGAHPFEKDGRTWIRAIIAENDVNQIADLENSGSRNWVGTYLDLVVYVFPASLADTDRISWRDPKYSEWFEEARQQWLPASGIAPVLPTHADFTSDGNRAAIQIYEYGGVQTTYGKRVSSRFGDTTIPDWYENIPKPRAALRPRTVQYDAETRTFILSPSQTPIINEILQADILNLGQDRVVDVTLYQGVFDGLYYPEAELNYSFSGVGMEINLFERRVQGEYQMFPFFDDNDVLQHMRLVVDEYQFDRGFGVTEGTDYIANRLLRFAPTSEDLQHYGWYQHKLIYPDGEEFILRQRNWWLRHMDIVGTIPATPLDWAINLPADITDPPFAPELFTEVKSQLNQPEGLSYDFKFGFHSSFKKPPQSPLTNETFTTIIHNWNPKTKEMVYSKEIYKDNPWKTQATDPETRYNLGGGAFLQPSFQYPPAPGEQWYTIKVIQTDKYLYHYDGAVDTLLWSEIPPIPTQDGVWDFGNYVGHPIPNPDFDWRRMDDYDINGDYRSVMFGSSENDSMRDWFFLSTECYNPQAEGLIGGLTLLDNISAPTKERTGTITYMGRLPVMWTSWLWTNFHEFTALDNTWESFEVAAFDNAGSTMSVIDRMSWENYEVSCCSHSQFTIEGLQWNMASTDLTTYSAQTHNIAPSFSSLPFWQKVNMLRYKDRWLTRCWFEHYATHFGRIPDYTITSVNLSPQPDFWLPDGEGQVPPQGGNPEWVILTASFDIDAATGMTGVTDVYPCAVL